MKNVWSRIVLSTVMAGGLLMAAGGSVQAARDYNNDCHKRLEADRVKVDRDVSRFGERSRQVDHDVQRMEETRAWCRNHKAEWEHDRFDTGVYLHR